MAAQLETCDVRRAFGGVHAVDGVSLAIEAGSCTGMIGPNGAGKTTFFNVLGGQLRASEGRIIFAGRDITGLAPHRRAALGIARSFQLAALFPRLTVAEQVTLAVRRAALIDGSRRRRDEARAVARILDEWGLEEGQGAYLPGELSYGEQRRVELALALAQQPQLLLLDEPNVGLTTEENQELVERLRRLRNEVTIVLVAHDMDVVFGLADRVVVLHRGKVIADGAPAAVRADRAVAEIYFGEHATA